MGRQLRGSIMLFMTALIWGTAFVAQKSGMDSVSPVAFNGVRTLIGGFALLPVIYIMTSVAKKKGTYHEETPQEKKILWIGGICCGLALMLAGNIQQIGMCYTTAGKTGFITALYVILVPLLGLVLKKKIRPIFWACVAASAVGLYLLCIPADGGFGNINKGDVIILVCSLMFAFHILTIDYFSPKVDGVKLSCIQFFVAGLLSCILAPILDPAMGFALPGIENLMDGWFEILYAGIMSCGVAYTFQVVAQADVEPTLASMILCLESVFAVIAGAILLGETMGAREIIGCALMFAAIVVAQLPSKDPAVEIDGKH
ncbi:MAG: DMT family transporter [Clostridiales bacterium]|nr:DMT family transporter [Clostridiales bacterium]MBQ3322762.1 DMT family transporter [Bacillota bacterium]